MASTETLLNGLQAKKHGTKSLRETLTERFSKDTNKPWRKIYFNKTGPTLDYVTWLEIIIQNLASAIAGSINE